MYSRPLYSNINENKLTKIPAGVFNLDAAKTDNSRIPILFNGTETGEYTDNCPFVQLDHNEITDVASDAFPGYIKV
jgi:hypothetical protein